MIKRWEKKTVSLTLSSTVLGKGHLLKERDVVVVIDTLVPGVYRQ
jgi:hypothetical protein